MNGPERLPTKTRKPFTGYLWGSSQKTENKAR